MPRAKALARRVRPYWVAGCLPKRSRKSLLMTAVMELTPESMLDIPAANMATTTRPEAPGGSRKAMK